MSATSSDPSLAALEAMSKMDPETIKALLGLFGPKTPESGAISTEPPSATASAAGEPAAATKPPADDDTIVTPSDGKPVSWINFSFCHLELRMAKILSYLLCSSLYKSHFPSFTLDFRDSTVMKNIAQVLGHDALRMRLRRLVEVKPNGKCHCDQQTREDYQNPERREWLEMALLQSIKKFGTNRSVFTKIRVGRCPKDLLILANV